MRKNKSILKTRKRFKSERHNVFTEDINNIALSSNNDKITQSIDSIETYALGMRKDLVSEKEEIKCSSLITYYTDDQKLIKFDDFTEENIKEYNQMWPQIFDHPYRISIINCSRS